jgi:hypothetical protein
MGIGDEASTEQDDHRDSGPRLAVIPAALRDSVEFARVQINNANMGSWEWEQALEAVRDFYRSSRGSQEVEIMQPLLDHVGLAMLNFATGDEAGVWGVFLGRQDASRATEEEAMARGKGEGQGEDAEIERNVRKRLGF